MKLKDAWTALKHVYYLGWNRSPAQVGCMRQVLRPGALGRPRGIGWRGRWKGGSGWGTHVNPWLIHFSVWQNPLQYCKVICLQLIKKLKKKKQWHLFNNLSIFFLEISFCETIFHYCICLSLLLLNMHLFWRLSTKHPSPKREMLFGGSTNNNFCCWVMVSIIAVLKFIISFFPYDCFLKNVLVKHRTSCIWKEKLERLNFIL